MKCTTQTPQLRSPAVVFQESTYLQLKLLKCFNVMFLFVNFKIG